MQPKCHWFFAHLGLLLIALGAGKAHATVYTVGDSVFACDYDNVRAALLAAASDPNGPHTIRVSRTTDRSLAYSYGEPDDGELHITTLLADIEVIGGYASCAATTPKPTGYTTFSYVLPTIDAQHTLLNISAAAPRNITFENATFDGSITAEDSGVTGPAFGGAILIGANIRLYLVESEIKNFQASSGGGIAALCFCTGNAVPQIHLHGSTLVDNHARLSGGGIYSTLTPISLIYSTIDSNDAGYNGGGIAIYGDSTSPGDVLLTVTHSLTYNGITYFSYNKAGTAGFATTRGFGGAVYLENASMHVDSSGEAGFQSAIFYNNSANYGGAIYAQGPDGAQGSPFAFIRLVDTSFHDNVALAKAGAAYSQNAVDWRFDSSQDCTYSGNRTTCSLMARNSARGQDASVGTPPNGGALYIGGTRTDGYSRGIMRILRTTFDANQDTGSAAVAAVSDSASGELVFNRDLFLDNVGADDATHHSALIYNNDGKDLDFRYNTVLANNVTRAFAVYGATLKLQGSIVWMPPHDFWYHDATATLTTNSCAIVNTMTDVPAGVFVVDPHLGVDNAPSGNSAALDMCDATDYTPSVDAYTQAVPEDVAGSPDLFGPYDLGAVEQTDVIYANSFGNNRLTN